LVRSHRIPKGLNASNAGLVTARTPHEHGGGDVSKTLSELERKLLELERELASTGPRPSESAPWVRASESGPDAEAESAAPPPEAPAPPPAPRRATGVGDADRLVAEARARLGGLSGQVDELLRFREQLHRTARELEDEYSRVLARIGAPPPPDAPPAPPTAYDSASQAPPADAPLRGPLTPPPGEQPPVPGQTVAPAPPAPPEPAQPPAPAQPVAVDPPAPEPAPALPYEDVTFEGPVVVDAGPFTDISALSTFEQGLAGIPGAEDVYVSGFEGNRALVELRLGGPVGLVREMRAVLPVAFTVTEAASGRVRVDVSPAPAGD
jgi:hypothetical protein